MIHPKMKPCGNHWPFPKWHPKHFLTPHFRDVMLIWLLGWSLLLCSHQYGFWRAHIDHKGGSGTPFWNLKWQMVLPMVSWI